MSAELRSDYIYRGVSLSDNRSTLGLTVAIDGRGGVYGGASAFGEDAEGLGPRGLGAVEYLGFALRPAQGPNLDFGVNNLSYTGYGYLRRTVDATDLYAGLLWPAWTVYLHYSPNYFSPGDRQLYAEANGSVKLAGPVKLIGHVGLLAGVDGHPGQSPKADVRAGIAARFKRGEIRLFWSSIRPNPLYSSDGERRAGELAVEFVGDF